MKSYRFAKIATVEGGKIKMNLGLKKTKKQKQENPPFLKPAR